MTRILVVNAGSSSLKVSVVDPDWREPIGATEIDWGSDATRATDRRSSLEQALASLPRDVAAAAHRVVHGGTRFSEPVLVDDGVLEQIDELAQLAPLHNPVAVEAIRAQRALRPDLPCIAVFDTAFHSTLTEDAYVYPLPYSWFVEWGVRRFGFHGLSVEWSLRRAAELLDQRAERLSLVVAHLGSGCSVTAVRDGRSVWTSMGFTPLEGLAMGTRSGSVDPGVLLFALREHQMNAEDLAQVLDHQSGLLGISGVSGDARALVKAGGAGNERALLALNIFVRRAAEGIAAAASNLDRLDAVVFTGGIGANASGLRSSICERLQVLGLPRVSSIAVDGDAVIAGSDRGVKVLQIEAREDLVMAKSAARLVPGI
jgi:acetate kinase